MLRKETVSKSPRAAAQRERHADGVDKNRDIATFRGNFPRKGSPLLHRVTYVTGPRRCNNLTAVLGLKGVTRNSAGRGMIDAISVAIRHLPDHREAIDALWARDAEFRSLCEDLGDADDALSRWTSSSSPKRSERLAEYEALVAALVDELREVLQRIALGPSSRLKGLRPRE